MSGNMKKTHLDYISRRTQDRLLQGLKRQRLNEDANENRVNYVHPEAIGEQNDPRTLDDLDPEIELRNDSQCSHFPDHVTEDDDRETDHESIGTDLTENEWYSTDGERDDNEANDEDESSENDDELNDNAPEHINNEEPEVDYLEEPGRNNNRLPDDNEENQQQQHEDDEEEDSPIFDRAPITLNESLICILTFALRFSLTGVALDALLKLIFLHCPTPNLCKKSLWLFKKYFASLTIPLHRRFYCNTCYNELDTQDSVCDSCPEDDVSPDDVSYFIEIPLLDQLKILFKRPGFSELLHQRFDRIKKNVNNYEDITDGDIYQQLLERRNLPDHNNDVSFSWNTDGVSLFKSSKTGIWPFYLSLNELPFIHRTRKENLLLAGLWFGSKKPMPSLFLDSICNQMDELKNGVNLEDSTGNQILVHAEVICGTCDLPAKALFLNMVQYNGKYGCQKCLIKTESFSEESAQPRIYPFQSHLNLRTEDQTINFANEAVIAGSDEDVFGVKGPSIISRLSRNYSRTTAVDIMHCVFLGVVRALLILWFQPVTGLLSQFSGIVDKIICSITPPNFIPRLPRSIIDNIMYLKAQELKTWFFYYSVPIMQTIMNEVYLKHYLLLVQSIYLLTQESVSEGDITMAEELIAKFVSQYFDLYGRTNMTANVHQLLHLSQTARDFGPLWTTTCFPFENANGILKSLVTGTKFAQLQICSGVSMFMNLPEIKSKLVPGSLPAKFCAILTDKKKKYKTHQVTEKLAIIGTVGSKNQLPDIINEILRAVGIDGTNIKIFYRLSISRIIYSSELYRRSAKTNSTYIKYKVDGQTDFGMIHCFTQVSNCNCLNFCGENCDVQYFAIIKKCRTILPFTVQTNVPLAFIHRLMETENDLSVVDVHDINSVCFFVKVARESRYIIEPVNMLEIE